MSNIYITEPATNGKVILKTTVGDIEIELWSKEAPLACRNFVQLCMEGYYNDTAFHRLVKGFIVQGGDPTGTGEGGESIYGKPFRTESHSRLSFNRRGLVGMACSEPNCNGSQFFFTLGEATELNTKHTLFGRVVGNTLFNMLRLAEVEVIKGDRPARLHRILKTEVIHAIFYFYTCFLVFYVILLMLTLADIHFDEASLNSSMYMDPEY
uniref:Peptidyl-prolyl cis-trans isomerase n=1 Tax=Schistocephalus solidus TaxID=70667 RepID=A0A0X3P0H5_SCHSO